MFPMNVTAVPCAAEEEPYNGIGDLEKFFAAGVREITMSEHLQKYLDELLFFTAHSVLSAVYEVH